MSVDVLLPNSSVAIAHANLAFDLLREANAANPAVSTILSPVSITILLAALYNGAKGKTARELRTNLGDVALKEIDSYYQAINRNMISSPEYTWQIANGIFMNNKYKLYSNFKRSLLKKYNFETQLHDFNTPTAVVQAVNQFIKRKTNDKIDNILTDRDIHPNSRAILTNAVYFQAEWENKFFVNDTIDGTFYSSPKVNKRLKFMRLRGKSNFESSQKFYEGEDFKCLALPYKGNNVTAYFILPSELYGLDDVLQKFDAQTFRTIQENAIIRKVEVKIPRIKFNSEHDVKALLQKKFPLAMSSKANFRRIFQRQNVVIDQFKQKAMIEVDENGSTATAANKMTLAVTLMISFTKEFIADHPFLLLLADNHRGSILFAATVRV